MNIILSISFVFLFCIDYYYIYHYTVSKRNLTQRQKAYIMSIKASVTLFLLSLYFNYKFMKSSDIGPGDQFVLKLGVLNLISYFIMDCSIGYYKYHKYLCSLSGYFHHIIYIFISLLSLKLNMASFYILFFIEELPTMILSIGHFNSNLRSDNLFGITFFITRILYHCFLIFYTYKHSILFVILGLLSFGLHSYWFKNWLVKYYINKKKKE
jgi:hypothetical protein